MRDTFGRFVSKASKFAGDRVLQMLVLGVIAVGFFAIVVLGADPSMGLGLVAIGVATAFIERAHKRDGE